MRVYLQLSSEYNGRFSHVAPFDNVYLGLAGYKGIVPTVTRLVSGVFLMGQFEKKTRVRWYVTNVKKIVYGMLLGMDHIVILHSDARKIISLFHAQCTSDYDVKLCDWLLLYTTRCLYVLLSCILHILPLDHQCVFNILDLWLKREGGYILK
jgi:hypothetical protein